jgi:hypothetical protein
MPQTERKDMGPIVAAAWGFASWVLAFAQWMGGLTSVFCHIASNKVKRTLAEEGGGHATDGEEAHYCGCLGVCILGTGIRAVDGRINLCLLSYRLQQGQEDSCRRGGGMSQTVRKDMGPIIAAA